MGDYEIGSKHLDAAFPNSKFVLTFREPESWWHSVGRWLTVTHRNDADKLQRYLVHLKVDRLERGRFVSGYVRFNDAIRSYFRKCADFLELNFENGDGWEKLCAFLEAPAPSAPFPHVNRQNY